MIMCTSFLALFSDAIYLERKRHMPAFVGSALCCSAILYTYYSNYMQSRSDQYILLFSGHTLSLGDFAMNRGNEDIYHSRYACAAAASCNAT